MQRVLAVLRHVGQRAHRRQVRRRRHDHLLPVGLLAGRHAVRQRHHRPDGAVRRRQHRRRRLLLVVVSVRVLGLGVRERRQPLHERRLQRRRRLHASEQHDTVRRRSLLHGERRVQRRLVHGRAAQLCRRRRPVQRRRLRRDERRLRGAAEDERHGVHDGNACTQTDTCQGGICTGTNPVDVRGAGPVPHGRHLQPALRARARTRRRRTAARAATATRARRPTPARRARARARNPVACTALDQCHDAGTCNPSTGACSNPAKTNGTPCNDGNACTQTDACQAGACTGANPVVCTAQDQCHDAGTCNPSTGACSNPAKTNGSPCSDGDSARRPTPVSAGACTGANPVTCTALDQCHDPGTCSPITGTCTNPPKTNGAPCSDGSACTTGDACQAGVCTSTGFVTCTAQDQCHLVGSCDAQTGLCSNPPRPNGAACTDGDACTQGDTCQSGACSSGDAGHVHGAGPVPRRRHVQFVDGRVLESAKPDGAPCSDGSACTQTDTCTSGACGGANPITCTPLDQCHDAGTCNPTTGACSNPPKTNGSPCNDGDACTQTDTCTSGACAGGNPVACAPADACHDAGVCNPSTGACSQATRSDGTTCDDGDPCTIGDACTSGTCGGGPSCGDGVVQAGCGEVCDAGVANGSNQCCSTSCTLVDGDGDGLCDAVDPCTNGVAFITAQVKLGRQTTPPGDDTLAWKGQLALPFPFTPPLDPSVHGVRLVLAHATSTVLDVAIPGGLVAGSPAVGWRNLNGVRWLYVDKNPIPGGGISKILIKHRTSTPGLLDLRVKGKRGSLPPVPETRRSRRSSCSTRRSRRRASVPSRRFRASSTDRRRRDAASRPVAGVTRARPLRRCRAGQGGAVSGFSARRAVRRVFSCVRLARLARRLRPHPLAPRDAGGGSGRFASSRRGRRRARRGRRCRATRGSARRRG